MKKIKLTCGHFAYVDDHVFNFAKLFFWRSVLMNKVRYAYMIHQNKIIYMHHFVVGLPINRKNKVDHIDGNGLNNLRENLRIVTHRQNVSNTKKNRCGGLVGARLIQGRYWQSRIRIGDKQVYLGNFKTKEEANMAYLKKLESINK